MDQAKTEIPHEAIQATERSQMTYLGTHIYGCLTHGASIGAFAYACLDWFSGSANTTCSVLLQVLLSLIQRGDTIPKTLYLQLDNSSKDNKNTTLLSFVAWMVYMTIIDTAEVCFLIKGHTHEDVDQMFSCFSRSRHRQPRVNTWVRELG